MNSSFFQLIIFLLAGIISIILLTVKFRVHPFFALIITCFVTGLGVQLPVAEISRFSDIDTSTMLHVHSVASILMGFLTMIVIYFSSLIIL